MNRTDILKLIGYSYPADFIDVQELLPIPKHVSIDENHLVLKVFNKLNSIELELKYLTEETSCKLMACHIILENELVKNISIFKPNSTEKLYLNIDEFKGMLLSILEIKCDNNINTFDFSI